MNCYIFKNSTTKKSYYLKLLLIHIRCPQSFDLLKTIDKIFYPTFKSVCVLLGLFEDDKEYQQCLKEASWIQSRYQLKIIFVIFLLHKNLINPINL